MSPHGQPPLPPEFSEIRYALSAALLHAREPVSLDELLRVTGVPREDALAMLEAMVESRAALGSPATTGEAEHAFCWSGVWAPPKWRAAEGHRPPAPDIESDVATAFHNFVIEDYTPPPDKRFLLLSQCAVRRPVSSAPSHSSIRRAVRLATGFDPAKDFHHCPVHVVIAISALGPVPYEFEDVYPANAGGAGVKQFGDRHYERIRPVLADRIADYLWKHGERYEHVAAFGDGRYAEVFQEAAERAAVEFAIFPEAGGAEVTHMGETCIRYYWLKYWIQLFLEIVRHLPAEQQAAARERLEAEDIAYRKASW